MLRGADSLAQRMFRIPVNIGIPRGFSSDGLAKEVSSPMYATAVGLALYSVKHARDFEDRFEEVSMSYARNGENGAGLQSADASRGFIKKIVNWFENL
jgi:cell division ATPase FtsA